MTPQQIEAMKLALEFVESINLGSRSASVEQQRQVIAAIKEALAQPKQEPVGQLLEDAFGRGQVMWFNKPKDESMLYTTPPQRKPLTDDLYNELLFAVENKYPDETRHQTALRYIKQAEMPSARPAQAAHGIKENQ